MHAIQVSINKEKYIGSFRKRLLDKSGWVFLVFKKLQFFFLISFTYHFIMDSERQLQIIAAKYKQQRKLYNEELKQAEAS